MFQIQVIPAVNSPKTAHLTENQREKTRNKNRHLEPDYLGKEDIALANNSTCNYDFYDDDVLKDEFYEASENEDNGADIDALIPYFMGKSIEEICIFCLVAVDKIASEEIGNALKTSREMARVRFHQIAEKMQENDGFAGFGFLFDAENAATIKNVVYSSAQEKLAYLYSLHSNTQKSTRGRKKSEHKTDKAQCMLFDCCGEA